jgi:hypothetical protein
MVVDTMHHMLLLLIITILVVIITTGTKMKKLVLAFALLLATPALAGNYNIDQCNNCNINVQRPIVKKVVKTVPVPVAVEYLPAGPGPISSTIAVPVVIPVQPAPLVPVYSYVPTPEASNIYSPPGYPLNVPVAASRNCAMYVDPYDLFGQLFGGADLVQSCLVPAY